MVYPALLPLMVHTSAASSRLNWRPPADLNGLVRLAERRNLVSARVPSHFNWPLLTVSLQDSRLQLKSDGTRWRTGGEGKGKLANAVGSQYPSHYLGTWCIQHYYRWCAHLGCASSRLNWPPPADLNGLVRLAVYQQCSATKGKYCHVHRWVGLENMLQ